MRVLFQQRPHWCQHIYAAAFVGVAFGARWLLGGFDSAIPYLTFYPAVMLASLLGGLSSGLVATLLSGLLATCFFIEPIGGLYITNPRDLLGLLVFIASSVLVSSVGDLYLRHRTRLNESSKKLARANAELQSEVEERRALTERLSEQELHFRTLANSGQALIWTATPDKLCNYFNERWLTFTGRTLEQELGNGWSEGVHPDDFAGCLDIYVTAFDRHERFSMEYRLRHADGGYRWIIDQGTPRFDSKGSFLGYIGHCLDITSMKQAEDDLHNAHKFNDMIIDMSASLFVVLDQHGTIVRFNQACENATGYRSEEVVGRVFWEIFLPQDDHDLAKQTFASQVAGGLPSFQETVWLTRDGARRHISWANGAILNAQGAVEFVIGTGMDITAERREMHAMEGLSAPLQTRATASSLGLADLKQSDPTRFDALADEFESLIDLALENLVLKVEHDVSKGIDRICEVLGALRAGPREATGLYVAALKRKAGKVTPSKYQAYSEEGRILIIELLGKLAAYYRNHCLGVGPQAGADRLHKEGGHE